MPLSFVPLFVLRILFTIILGSSFNFVLFIQRGWETLDCYCVHVAFYMSRPSSSRIPTLGIRHDKITKCHRDRFIKTILAP